MIAAVFLTCACRVDADFSGTAYACPDGKCPSGFQCIDERCVSESPAFDASVDAADGTAADAADCVCVSTAFADSCTGGVQGLPDVGQPGGQRVCASTEMNSNELLGCTGAPTPAADAVYQIAVDVGQQIDATLRPIGFDGALYIMLDCSLGCVDISDDNGIGGTEQLSVQVPATGDMFVVVDSGSGTGCYELTVSVN